LLLCCSLVLLRCVADPSAHVALSFAVREARRRKLKSDWVENYGTGPPIFCTVRTQGYVYNSTFNYTPSIYRTSGWTAPTSSSDRQAQGLGPWRVRPGQPLPQRQHRLHRRPLELQQVFWWWRSKGRRTRATRWRPWIASSTQPRQRTERRVTVERRQLRQQGLRRRRRQQQRRLCCALVRRQRGQRRNWRPRRGSRQSWP
jgi:hypothetical protein